VFAVTAAAVTVNETDVLPVGTVADAGVVKLGLLSRNCSVTPGEGASRDNLTVQVALSGGSIEAGTQLNECVIGCDVMVTVPPVPVVKISSPSFEAVTASEIVIGIDGSDTFVAIRKKTFATRPSAITFLFSPTRMHFASPAELAQVISFPAIIAAEPGVASNSITAAVGYRKVHCRPAGCAPDGPTVVPGSADADDKDIDAL
jgi:hypothetical protein